MGFSTDAIHGGQENFSKYRDVIPPIHLATTYDREDIETPGEFSYSRGQNPVRAAAEENIALLEKTRHALLFSSGVAAINAVYSLLNPGDHILISSQIYGGTYRILKYLNEKYGITHDYFNEADLSDAESKLRPQTRMIYIETPSNPLFNVYSLKAASDLAKKHNLISVSDNTFLTPYLQNPAEYGTDIIIHSSTKFINGHSDVIGGVVCVSDSSLSDKLKFLQRSTGAVPSPFDAWLILRSLKTLKVRMDYHTKSAAGIADALKSESFVKAVYYPGWKSAVENEIQNSQARGRGGVISFVADENVNLKEATAKLKIVKVAESLGGVETIMSQPFNMSHAVIPASEKNALGITKNLLRLSVGLEDTEDIIADIVQAFR